MACEVDGHSVTMRLAPWRGCGLDRGRRTYVTRKDKRLPGWEGV